MNERMLQYLVDIKDEFTRIQRHGYTDSSSILGGGGSGQGMGQGQGERGRAGLNINGKLPIQSPEHLYRHLFYSHSHPSCYSIIH
jgi:hypothetical protein